MIDEMSMLDLSLMQALIAALPAGCRLVMVGDPAQLPPVSSGAVWHRLQQDDVRPRFGPAAVHLVKTYRNRGALASLAAALRDGGMASPPHLEGRPPACATSLAIWRLPELLRSRWRERLAQLNTLAEGLDRCREDDLDAEAAPLLEAIERELVLCPRRKGPWSVDDLHRSLLGEANAADPLRWPRGLPVICGGNQPDLGLANGDLGVVIGGGDCRQLLFRVVGDEGDRRCDDQSSTSASAGAGPGAHHSPGSGSEADRVMVLASKPGGSSIGNRPRQKTSVHSVDARSCQP